MNIWVPIIAGILSCVYFELSFILLPIPWLRITIYLLSAIVLAYINHNIFNKQFANLHHFIKETLKGNYSYSIKSTGYNSQLKAFYHSILELKNKLLKYIFEMQVAESQISSATQQLIMSLDDNTQFAQQLYTETQTIYHYNTESYNHIDATVNEVNDITGILKHIKTISEELRTTSSHSEKIISESLQEILKIVYLVNDIKQSTDVTQQYISRLNTATKEIASIFETVDNIAKQTHLLSLNASIESARAGEHGRGFGVVAEEIRQLADDSKEAVSQITSLLNNVSVEVSDLTAKIQDNQDSVSKSVQYSKNVEKSLNKIEDSYGKVQNMIQNIINMSEKQYTHASNISQKIENVQSISQQAAASFDIVYESVNKQKDNFKEIEALCEYLSNASSTLSLLTEKAETNILKDNMSKFNSIAQDIIEVIKKEVLTADDILSFDSKTHQILLDEVLKQHASIEAIWTNNAKGQFIYSNPPAGIVNAKVREWFQESIKGKEFISPIYISAITKNPCITLSLPITNTTGQCIGVIGVDLKLDI
ncbi:MAG: hypothetical protein PWP27_1666 [Clostridiales bacterium]|jgi:methyl-accepting chemotaxis protein|nr:hypothetical protein [Clostridiales bacterium]MDK2933856.1 hypothetical protein [Clostridiales bacterium]